MDIIKEGKMDLTRMTDVELTSLLGKVEGEFQRRNEEQKESRQEVLTNLDKDELKQDWQELQRSLKSFLNQENTEEVTVTLKITSGVEALDPWILKDLVEDTWETGEFHFSDWFDLYPNVKIEKSGVFSEKAEEVIDELQDAIDNGILDEVQSSSPSEEGKMEKVVDRIFKPFLEKYKYLYDAEISLDSVLTK